MVAIIAKTLIVIVGIEWDVGRLSCDSLEGVL
jgi:hypothetical protein